VIVDLKVEDEKLGLRVAYKNIGIGRKGLDSAGLERGIHNVESARLKKVLLRIDIELDSVYESGHPGSEGRPRGYVGLSDGPDVCKKTAW
jgi:hypothetical protein